MGKWWFFGGLAAGATAGLAGWVRLNTLQPRPVQSEGVYTLASAPQLQDEQPLKVLTWNVQYMAGKNHYFFYEGGEDSQPTQAEMHQTLAGVAQIITAEEPDVILLQEVDDGAERTGRVDQLALLRHLLPPVYNNYTTAFYWQAGYVPHPKIQGAVGMKLVILSKYQIEGATRYQLPYMPRNWFMRQFNPKRAVLEARFRLTSGRVLRVFNTHLDAFAMGTDTLQQQVTFVQALLERYTQQKLPWVLGGDFNLLPPGQWGKLSEMAQGYYRPESELRPLYEAYHPAVPPQENLDGPTLKKWFTLLPNSPRFPGPTTTVDHIFVPPYLTIQHSTVRQHDTTHISDHFPLVAQLAHLKPFVA